MILSTTIAAAQFSPGDLSRPHQNLDGPKNCTQCHEVGSAISGEKCLSCHTEIGQMITSRHGYHFSVKSRACIECHKEHLGRDAVTYLFNKRNFEHAQTGFTIGGKHALLECEKCHDRKFISDPDVKKVLSDHPHPTFLGVSQACTSCHQNPHEEAEQQRCLTCHTDAGWNVVKKFDHSTTHFVLLGKHRTVECKQCHVTLAQKNPGTPKVFTVANFAACEACHTSPHTQKLQQQKCTACHS